jgi:hypothetical protein
VTKKQELGYFESRGKGCDPVKPKEGNGGRVV